MHTALTAAGETMPKNLIEALVLDAYLERNFSEEIEELYLRNWMNIQDGKYPITSHREAIVLLERLEVEREHSGGDFEQKILTQVREFLSNALTSQRLEAAA